MILILLVILLDLLSIPDKLVVILTNVFEYAIIRNVIDGTLF